MEDHPLASIEGNKREIPRRHRAEGLVSRISIRFNMK
jgi:hypothetical protein